MKSHANVQIETDDEAGTLAFGSAVGASVKGGEIIELVGDVGSGKTVFVKGLAAGMGITETVSSPSFTISNQYKASDLTLFHYDFYRLGDPGIMLQEIEEQLGDKLTVVAIEWPEIIEDRLPAERMTISFSSPREQKRMMDITTSKRLQYLVPAKYLTR